MYLTIEQSIRNNGHRHLERAIAYASAQWPEHYVLGSLRKAERNFKKADTIAHLYKTDPIMQAVIDRMNGRIAVQIMYDGNGNDNVGLSGLLKETKCQKCLNVLRKLFKRFWKSLNMLSRFLKCGNAGMYKKIN